MSLAGRARGLSIAGACGLTLACAAPEPDRRACAAEAEQLLRGVVLYAMPAAGQPPLAELQDGHFVYRCERRGAWLAVMFPAAGEAVDCSLRGVDDVCRIGWVWGDVATAVLG